MGRKFFWQGHKIFRLGKNAYFFCLMVKKKSHQKGEDEAIVMRYRMKRGRGEIRVKYLQTPILNSRIVWHVWYVGWKNRTRYRGYGLYICLRLLQGSSWRGWLIKAAASPTASILIRVGKRYTTMYGLIFENFSGYIKVKEYRI